jgi:hypothetical protein
MAQRCQAACILLKGIGVAGAMLPADALLASGVKAAGIKGAAVRAGRTLGEGDVAILRFLAAAEIIETDRSQTNQPLR